MNSSQVQKKQVKLNSLCSFSGVDRLCELLNSFHNKALNFLLRVQNLIDQSFAQLTIKSNLFLRQGWRDSNRCSPLDSLDFDCIELVAINRERIDPLQPLFTIMHACETYPGKPLEVMASYWLTHREMDIALDAFQMR